jgi:acetyl-CoA carboxylase biotin carboxyl carrier protein
MLTPEEINRILNALQESEWDEAVVEIGEVRIAVARNGAGISNSENSRQLGSKPTVIKDESNSVSSIVAEKGSEENAPIADPNGTTITAPSVGIFWRSPDPGAAPFVEIGKSVNQGDVLCIVEVMKLMMNVTASKGGVISSIHIQNGDAVEFGTPLFTISQN